MDGSGMSGLAGHMYTTLNQGGVKIQNQKKSLLNRPLVGKDLEQKIFLELVLEAIEGLINRGFFILATQVYCSAGN